MSPEEITEELTVDPFVATGQLVRDEWLVVWTHEGMPVGQATFREVPGGLIEWTRFWGANRSQGLYSKALEFSAARGGARIRVETGEKDFYLSAGFKETDDGWLVSKPRAAKAWLKER